MPTYSTSRNIQGDIEVENVESGKCAAGCIKSRLNGAVYPVGAMMNCFCLHESSLLTP